MAKEKKGGQAPRSRGINQSLDAAVVQAAADHELNAELHGAPPVIIAQAARVRADGIQLADSIHPWAIVWTAPTVPDAGPDGDGRHEAVGADGGAPDDGANGSGVCGSKYAIYAWLISVDTCYRHVPSIIEF